MINLNNSDKYVYGVCRASDLDAIDIKCSVKNYSAGQKCTSILGGAKSVIVVGSVITKEMDVCKRGILADDFLSYKDSRLKAKEISDALKNMGYKSKVSVSVSIKNACVLSGIGVFGKNSLIIHPTHGTLLRFATVITDWIPDLYSVPLDNFKPCDDCEECLNICNADCLTPFKVDGLRCECTYIEKGQKINQTLAMCSKCQDVCKYNTAKTETETSKQS